MIVKLVLALTLVLELTCTAAYAEIIDVDWFSSASSGDMGGISVSHSTSFYNFSYDLSGENYAFAPLSTSQETILFSSGSGWTMTFGSAVDGLLLYIYAWRGTDPDNATNINPPEYTFDTSFTIRSGLDGASVTGNTLILPTTEYYFGIIEFRNPLTSLSVNVVANSATNYLQSLTVAYNKNPLPVLTPIMMILLNK